MRFMSSLPWIMNNCATIQVIMDMLTKSTYFILIQINYPLERLAELYIEKIVSLHGIPSKIVSYGDPRFMSRFWESLQKSLGTKLCLSSAYHPQTDG